MMMPLPDSIGPARWPCPCALVLSDAEQGQPVYPRPPAGLTGSSAGKTPVKLHGLGLAAPLVSQGVALSGTRRVTRERGRMRSRLPTTARRSQTMRPIRSIVTFAIAGLVGALGVVSAMAVPATANASIHVSRGSAVSSAHANVPAVDINCSYHGDKFATYTNGCANWTNWTCRQGNENSISGPDYVANACALNVDLYTNSNETGTVLCIRLDSKTSLTAGRWHSFRMITGGC
jgi:hypothetical protein